ncbi:hypothetical protein CRUP_027023 [Coryphaenoides rupestris]|nr:hypothetical protein CRUP_027023 [Coryphaenoides rupestris]
MTEEVFIYQFTLHYTPSAVGASPIVRTRDVSVNVECHYPRHGDVSSAHVRPTWTPFAETRASEESLFFSLKLMTDDWQFERPSTQYFLGDQLNIQAFVSQFHHTPLRLFVDRCVATLIPNTDTVHDISFLDNYGIQVPDPTRVQDDKLQIQLEAFRFQQESSGVVCGWRESSGVHGSCSCCETSCGSGGLQAQPPGKQWEFEKAVGPIGVNQQPLK